MQDTHTDPKTQPQPPTAPAIEPLLECGHPKSDHVPHTTGYGMHPDGSRACYDCCHAEDMKRVDNGQPIFGYISKADNGAQIVTNWPGGKLMTITSDRKAAPLRFGRPMWLTDAWHYYHAIDHNGRLWVGQGAGEGMYARLRPARKNGAPVYQLKHE